MTRQEAKNETLTLEAFKQFMDRECGTFQQQAMPLTLDCLKNFMQSVTQLSYKAGFKAGCFAMSEAQKQGGNMRPVAEIIPPPPISAPLWAELMQRMDNTFDDVRNE